MQIAEIATVCKTTMAEIAHLEVCWFKTIAHGPSRSHIDQVGSAEPTLTLFSAQVTWALLHAGEGIHFTAHIGFHCLYPALQTKITKLCKAARAPTGRLLRGTSR